MRAIYFIMGPTAVGKTEASLLWAEANDAEIINADSLCFYRGMNIGTAKPGAVELQRVPHHCLDFLDPPEQYSVADYVKLSTWVAESILARGKRVLVTGGSGFYLKSFFSNVVDSLQLDPAGRNEVEALFVGQGLEGLLKELAQYNPMGFDGLDIQNPRRVMAALRRCRQSGKSVVELRREFEQLPQPFAGWEKKVCLLTRPEDELRQRIQQRAEVMVESGLVEEVRGLLEGGILSNPSAAGAIGYRETIEFLRTNGTDLKVLSSTIATNTWKLVRKQRTWFRHQIPISCEISASDFDPLLFY